MDQQTPAIVVTTQANFTDQHLSCQVPILVSDGSANWPAMSKWSPLAFSSMTSNPKVNLQVSRSGVFSYNPDGSARDRANQLIISNITFREAAKSICAGTGEPKYYISQQDLVGKLPELVENMFPSEKSEALSNSKGDEPDGQRRRISCL